MYMNKGPDFEPKNTEKPEINRELYKKMKKEKPVDAFKKDLSLESMSSKIALANFFLFVVSLGALDMKTLTIASFVGFIMFSAFYAFLRIRNR